MTLKHFFLNDKEQFDHQLHKCLRQNPRGSFRLGNLAFYSALFGNWKKEYKQALTEANKYILPEVFWPSLQRVAAMGQLGEIEEATSEIMELKRLKPDFEEQASFLLGKYIKEKSLIDHMLDGLCKAGMNL